MAATVLLRQGYGEFCAALQENITYPKTNACLVEGGRREVVVNVKVNVNGFLVEGLGLKWLS